MAEVQRTGRSVAGEHDVVERTLEIVVRDVVRARGAMQLRCHGFLPWRGARHRSWRKKQNGRSIPSGPRCLLSEWYVRVWAAQDVSGRHENVCTREVAIRVKITTFLPTRIPDDPVVMQAVYVEA